MRAEMLMSPQFPNPAEMCRGLLLWLLCYRRIHENGSAGVVSAKTAVAPTVASLAVRSIFTQILCANDNRVHANWNSRKNLCEMEKCVGSCK